MLKVTIEVPEKWIEKGEIQEALRNDIINKVSIKLMGELSEKHIKSIEDAARKKVEERFSVFADAETRDFIEYGLVSSYNNSSKKITVKEYIADRFNNSNAYNSQRSLIEKLAKEYSIEMKNRYDMMFASQLVIKLNEQGMLKEGVFESLMTKE